MPAYYNEFKPEAAHMLRQLIKDGLIAPGDVDDRSITEVKASDLIGYTQCHFFAGIGGWSVALRLAGWPDDRPVWTGSCPCQPYSSAGKKEGAGDERHLWPDWARLIRESKPATIFGEQVAGAIAYGWLDEVFNDLEAEAYACASAILPACSVGRAHRRDRLWFVADACLRDDGGTPGRYARAGGKERLPERHENGFFGQPGGAMGDADRNGSHDQPFAGIAGTQIQHGEEGQNDAGQFAGNGEPGNVANTEQSGLERFAGHGDHAPGWQPDALRPAGQGDSLEWLECPDGKARPVSPGIRLLAHGLQHRAPVLHAFGNAIVPQVAAEFIKATY